MSAIKKAIYQKLADTEAHYGVKIPLAIESGSRGWGFASPDSDYDCRFIYVHPRDWYLSVFDKSDTIDYAVDPVFDINGWDVKKVLQHIVKSNAVMCEWLCSNEIYIKNVEIAELLLGLAKDFFNPIAVSYHYVSIAKNKLGEIMAGSDAKLKHYLYVLRPIANLHYIHQYGTMPYMEYAKTLAETEPAPNILAGINDLLQAKAVSDESVRVKPNKMLIAYFQSEIEHFSEVLTQAKHEKNRDYARVDAVFKEIIERMWLDADNGAATKTLL